MIPLFIGKSLSLVGGFGGFALMMELNRERVLMIMSASLFDPSW